eukprot:285682-Chlamydomonas_euryale.AAC.5
MHRCARKSEQAAKQTRKQASKQPGAVATHIVVATTCPSMPTGLSGVPPLAQLDGGAVPDSPSHVPFEFTVNQLLESLRLSTAIQAWLFQNCLLSAFLKIFVCRRERGGETNKG